MISLDELFIINKMLVEKFGGMGVGFNNLHLAESLVVQVDQEVFGKILYPSTIDKISFIVFSIIANHVFLDGNKRTGAFVLDKLCEDNNIPLQCNDDAIIDVVLKIATSEFNREDLSKWIFVNSKEEH